MPKTIEYIGTQQRWPELATTGKQSTWMPGQAEERGDAEAALLLSTGLFKAPDDTFTAGEIAAVKLLVAEPWMGPAVLALIGAAATRLYLDGNPLWLDNSPIFN